MLVFLWIVIFISQDISIIILYYVNYNISNFIYILQIFLKNRKSADIDFKKHFAFKYIFIVYAYSYILCY